MVADAALTRFLEDPSEYFAHSLTRMLSAPATELHELQLAGVRRRYEQFRHRIPMLERLADQRGVQAIGELDDVLPLLFDHAIYKSYPSVLLEKQRFAQLTAWLQKLTTHDLSNVDVSSCHSIDEWLVTLNRGTPLAVCHTSGTSGTMSFLPWAKGEWRKMFRQYPVLFFQTFGQPAQRLTIPLNIHCIYPYFRSGGLSHTLANDAIVEIIAGDEARFHAAFPQRLSADLLLLAAKRKAAAARGAPADVDVSPQLLARRDQFEAMQRDMPARIADFFALMRTQLAGERVFILATSNLLYSMAESGLKQGVRKIFSPDSVVVTGGGGKGIVLPPDWQATVCDFLGVERLHNNYGMSEMAGQFSGCERGNYHAAPWIVPFILDPQTRAPLPRTGRRTGLFAFYDLLPDSRWGGFVTGDEVTLDWDTPCGCGRTAPFLHPDIHRYSNRAAGDDDKISCAETSEAYEEALDFLNDVGT
jgi:hypothetical protein